jgi:hypothetical protein
MDPREYAVTRGPLWAFQLTLVFGALKLFGQLSWSWWWVLSPVIATATILTILLILVFTQSK